MERKVKFTPNEYYHLYSRGVEKRKIYLSDKDRDRFMALLYIMNQPNQFVFSNFLKRNKLSDIYLEERSKTLVSIVSYTLMPNHFHILVYENEEGGITKFMARLLTAYSMYFNKKYDRSGPLFVHPFRAQHISNESQYLWIFSYIHLNPIGIINKDFKMQGIGDKSKAEDFLNSYKYSSFIDYKNEKIKRSEAKIIDFSLIHEYLLNNPKMTIRDYEKYFLEE